MPDYSQGKIYKLCDNEKYYIGSTCKSLKQRLSTHKGWKNKKMKCACDNMNWDNVQIELLEECPVNNKEELLEKENYYILAHKKDTNCVNILRAIRPEYMRTDNYYHTQYYKNNKDKCDEYTKKYRQTDAGKEARQREQSKYKDKYTENNIVLNCPICNSIVTKYKLNRHQKTNKCLSLR